MSSIQSMGLGWNIAMDIAQKKKEQEGTGNFADLFASLTEKNAAVQPQNYGNNAVSPSDSKAIGATSSNLTSTKDDAAQQFLDMMGKNPRERMLEAWLRQNGYTKEEFEALSPEEREKLIAKFEQQLEERIKQSTEKKLTEAGGAFA